MINNLDPDLKFIFENPSKYLNFLDTVIRVVETNLVLYQLKELKEHRKHPAHIIDYRFTKKLQSECQTEIVIAIHLSELTIPTIISIKKILSCLDRIRNKELKTCFKKKKKVLLSTRHASNLRKLLTTAKFERLPTRTNKASWIFSLH